MTLSAVLSAEQFALYQSAIGAEPEDIALALTDLHYRLDEATARTVAYLCWSERRAWDQWRDFELGISAADAEWDLDAHTFPSCPKPAAPNQATTAKEAYRVACRAKKALRLNSADLIVVIVGAFLLDMDLAADIACAASAGRDLGDVFTTTGKNS